MANGHVEIHDPMPNRIDHSSGTDCDLSSTSDTDNMGDSVEYRLLMAYAQRRQPKKDIELSPQDGPMALNGHTCVNGPPSPQAPAKTEKEEEEKEKKKRRKKKGWKRMLSFLSCMKPRTIDEELPKTIEMPPDFDMCAFRSVRDGVEEENELEEVVTRLAEIANEIPFIPPEIEADSPDDVEKVIALLLRDAGDRLNDRELKDALTARDIFWDYRFFKKLITTLLRRMGLVASDPEALGPQASPKTQIAVTCEVTTRLSAVDTLPMNRMLDHGARYLQDHYSSWVQQQGGYEEAFYSDDEDDE